MNTDYRCPECSSGDLDDGSFTFDDPLSGRTKTHTPSPLHFSCMECEWEGNNAAEAGDYEAMMDDKAEGEREDRKLAEYASIMANVPGC